MRREKLLSHLIVSVIGSVLALAGIGCLSTAFGLPVADWTHLICLGMVFGPLCVLCIHLRWGSLVLTALVLIGTTLMLRYSDLMTSLEMVVYRISRMFSRAYGWPYIQWSEHDLSAVSADTFFIVLTFAITVLVCCCKYISVTLTVTALPLLLCCVLTDTVPAELPLGFLLCTWTVLLLVHRPRQKGPSNLPRMVALVLVPVMLFTAFIFRVSPGIGPLPQAQALQSTLLNWAQQLSDLLPDGWFEIPGAGSQGSVTLPSKVDLSTAGPIDLGHEALMQVDSSKTQLLYLRGQSYDRYTGTSWVSEQDTAKEGGWRVRKGSKNGSIRIQTPQAYPLLYFCYGADPDLVPGKLEGNAIPNKTGLKEYTIATYAKNLHLSTPVASLSPEEEEIYLSLPEKTKRYAAVLLEELNLSPGVRTEVIANQVAAYVMQSASYDTNTASMPDGNADFVIWFLEESDTGYCVHFASAATVLLRAAGVPARYVTGYMANVVSDQLCYITADQAHAWVEYYSSTGGWTRLEVTPGEALPPQLVNPPTEPTETTLPTETTIPTETTLPTETTIPTETTVPTETTLPTETAPRPTQTDPTATAPTETVPPPSSTAPSENPGDEQIRLKLDWIRGLLIAAAVWLLLAGQYRLRIRLRHWWMNRGTANEQTRKRWRYARRLAKLSRHNAKELLDVAEKAAFSQHTITQEELAAFDHWYHEASQAMLQGPWLRQFLLRLIFAIET